MDILNWTYIDSNTKIPYDKLLLIEDTNGFIGVGYWDGYDWVLDVPYDKEVKNYYFAKIVKFVILK